MPLALAVTLDPIRVATQLDVTGIPGLTASLLIERSSPSGAVEGVRGSAPASVSLGTAEYLARDYEVPLGVELVYTVAARNAGGTTLESASTTYTVPSSAAEDPWLVDLARPVNSAQVIVASLEELEYESAVGVHRVLERRAPVLTTAPSWTPRTRLIFFTETRVGRDRARAALGTGVPILLRTDPEQGVGNLFLGVTGFTEARPARLAQLWTRRFEVEAVQVERPDPSIYLPVPPMTYDRLAADYPTYAAVLAGFANYEQLTYSIPAGAVAPFPPWLPDDV